MHLKVHRIPFSTNVERVALGAGIKGIDIEWVDHDPGDRSGLIALSGQELVPVAEFDGEVVADSVAILTRMDMEFLDRPLWPVRADVRPRAEIFVEWFNRVWKIAPNALDADPQEKEEEGAAEAHVAAIRESVDLFDKLLGGPPYLSGMAPGIEDVCAYPFLRYAVDEPANGDDERFHAILHEHLSPGTHPALDAWVARMAELPQA